MAKDFLDRLRIADGSAFRLADFEPGGPDDLDLDKASAKPRMEAALDKLRDLQERLYAEGRWSVLVVLQGMDASGKDGLVEHVMSGVNPQGCRVTSFKAPSSTELKHDFLWRSACALPERGAIAIFNRSHYEEVLVVRVHREMLDKQMLPQSRVTDDLWTERFESIRAFEQHLALNGTLVLKFFLHLSRKEQKKRFLARIDDASKNWKFGAGDIGERQHWDEYIRAYEDAIRHTATPAAPWHIVPADHKWLARLVVAETIVAALERIDPRYPSVDDVTRAAMQRARAQLSEES